MDWSDSKHYVGRSRDLLHQCVMPIPAAAQGGGSGNTKWQHPWRHRL